VAELCRSEWLAEHDRNERQRGDTPSDTESNAGRTATAKRSKADSDAADAILFAQRLVEGTLAHQEDIDLRLQAVARNWDLKRMAIVDRNVMRVAAYELIWCDDVPPKVAINEAIEIGKKFSTANSGGFVNGILDRIRIDLEQERKKGGAAAGPAPGQAETQDGAAAEQG
jgi:N utilization substance protein B